MLSRRQILTLTGTVGLGALAGCSLGDELHLIELANKADTDAELTIEVFKVEGNGGGSAPSGDEIQEQWRWSFWLQSGESRGIDSPTRNGGTYYVRASTAELENGVWTTSWKIVEITLRQNALQMDSYNAE